MKGFLKRLFNRDADPDRGVAARHRRAAAQPYTASKSPAAKTAPGPRSDPAPELDWVLDESDRDVPDDHFDPYNTGTFDRGISWDKAGRRKKR